MMSPFAAALPLVALLLLVPTAQAASKVQMYSEGANLVIKTKLPNGKVVVDGKDLTAIFTQVDGLQTTIASLKAGTTTVTDTTTTTTATSTTETTTTTTTTTTETTAISVDDPLAPLLTDAEMDVIKGWVNTDFRLFVMDRVEDIVAERCYSTAAAGDGGAAAGFHAGCDGNTHTVTVVKTTDGHVFGGTSDKDWGSENNYYQSDDAFLFCIHCAGSTTGTMEQLKVVPGAETNALAVWSNYGPTWSAISRQRGHALHLSDLAVQQPGSYSSLNGDFYTCPCPACKDNCATYFAGNFVNTAPTSMVAGYEVYALSLKPSTP